MSAMKPSRDERPYWPVITGALDAGAYTLPDVVRDALDRRCLVIDARTAIATAPSTPTKLLARVRDATAAGTPLPAERDLDSIAKELGRDAARAAYVAQLDLVIDQARLALRDTIAEHAETIIVEHLRTALDETVADAQRCVDALDGHGFDPADLLTAPDDVRAARVQLDTITGRYRTIRSGRAALNRVGHVDVCAFDEAGEFAEMADDEGTRRAWGDEPSDATERLYFLLTHGARLWLPTAAERDEAWAAAHPHAPKLRGRGAVRDYDGGARVHRITA